MPSRHAHILLMLMSLLTATACADLAEDDPVSNTSAQDMAMVGREDMASAGSTQDQGAAMDMGASADMVGATPAMDMSAPTVQQDMNEGTYTHTLIASQQRVDFAMSSPSYTQTRHITISHEGTGAITLGALGDAIDADELTMTWVRANGEELPARTQELTLDEAETIMLRLVHTSPDDITLATPRTYTLELFTLDAFRESLKLDIRTHLDAPCLDIELPPSASLIGPAYTFELGALNRQDTARHEFSLTNCGEVHPITLKDIYLTRNPYGVLSLTTAQHQDPAELITIAPMKTHRVTLSTMIPAQPPQLQSPFHIGQLTGSTDATGLDMFTVTIQASSGEQSCPRADARAKSVEESRPATLDALTLAPLGTARLEAAGIVAGQNAATVTWSILSKPVTSHTVLREVLPSSNMTPGSELTQRDIFLDVPGDYLVELQTFGPGERTACQRDVLLIEAVPTQDIYISTTWDTPYDMDTTDRQGADIDLHYLHPQGAFEDEIYDIFWRNRTADWGSPGLRDDPKLLRDDRDGVGPEVIAHDFPEPGQIYRVGVHYFDPAGFGASYASTTIHIQGVLAATSTAQLLPTRNAYLNVGTITWTTPPGVAILNTLLTGPP